MAGSDASSDLIILYLFSLKMNKFIQRRFDDIVALVPTVPTTLSKAANI